MGEWKLLAGSGIDRIRIYGFILTERPKILWGINTGCCGPTGSEWGIIIAV